MSWAWPQLQKSGPAKTGPAGPLATALQPHNAFEVLMSSQRQLARTLPQRKHPRNKKDELYNDLLTLLEEKALYFLSSDGESAGHNFESPY